MCNLLLLVLIVAQVYCANVLFVSQLPSPSHTIWNQALAVALTHRGHNVTFISPDKNNVKLSNFHHIQLEGIYESVENAEDFDPNTLGDLTPLRMMLELQDFSSQMCASYLETKGFQSLMNYSKDFKFDIILLDLTAGGCFYPLIRRFNYPPAIGTTPFLLPTYISYNFGGHLYPSYVSWHSFAFDNNMGLVDKLWNYFFSFVEAWSRYVKQFRQDHQVAKKYFGEEVPSLTELERHISLVFANTDPILHTPQPLPPNIIPVGGLQTRESEKLPQDLQQILDGAKEGAIVFSLGSNVRSDLLDKEKQQKLMDAFGKLRQTVIWKFESQIDNLPKNVIIRQWLPQNDLLGHPNVKLFIGHGGALSTHEAVFHGIPMILVPFFMDQFINTKLMVDKKVGLHLDLSNFTANHFLQMLTEVLSNPIYTESAQKLSKRFRDQLGTPLERAVFWTEYAIRHEGADFLNTAARDLSFFKSSGLDVLVAIVLVFVLILILKQKFQEFSKSSKNKKKVKKN